MRWILRIVGFPLRLVVIAFTLMFFAATNADTGEHFARSIWRFAMGQQDWM